MQRPNSKRFRCGLWLLFGIILAIVAVAATLSGLFVKALGDIDARYEYYGPTDSRIINIFNVMCEGVQLRVGESQPGYQVYLYTLNSTPTAVKHSRFQLVDERPYIQYKSEFEYYSHYMLSGSTFNVSACVLENNLPRINSYVIKGRKDFENFPDSKEQAVLHASISSPCQLSNDSYSYSVDSEDFYFIVFEADGLIDSTLSVNLSFDLLRYEVLKHTILEECHLDTSFKRYGICSVDMPLSRNVSTLLQVTPAKNTTDIDWSFSASAGASCSPRIWLYVVIGCSMLIAIITPFASLFIVCKLTDRRRVPKARLINATDPLLPSSTSSDYGLRNPPPYEQ